MLIKSKQPGMTFKKNNPKFSYTFESEPVEVKKEHYEILKKEHPKMFEEVKKKEVKK